MQEKIGSKPLIENKEKIKLEKILAKKDFGNGWRYLIKWKNIPLENTTWETPEKLKLEYKKEYDAYEKKLDEIKSHDRTSTSKKDKAIKSNKIEKINKTNSRDKLSDKIDNKSNK